MHLHPVAGTAMLQREPSPAEVRSHTDSESREDRKSPGRRDQPLHRDTSPGRREEPPAAEARRKRVRKREKKPSGEEPRSAREAWTWCPYAPRGGCRKWAWGEWAIYQHLVSKHGLAERDAQLGAQEAWSRRTLTEPVLQSRDSRRPKSPSEPPRWHLVENPGHEERGHGADCGS